MILSHSGKSFVVGLFTLGVSKALGWSFAKVSSDHTSLGI